jgi:prepilin-type N-terminal cleavage/methylation domain-containing protein
MPNLTRRGFTLVELLIAIVILGIVSAALYRVLVNNQRMYQAQTQHIDLQQNIRAAVTILPADLREIDATDGDIKAMSASAITIRAMRYLAIVCSPPVLGAGTNGIPMIIRRAPFWGVRGINTATDSLFIYYEGNESSRKDDNWALARPTAVVNSVCPDALAKPGFTVTLNFSNVGGGAGQVANTAGAILNGAPVRGFETVTYQVYQPVGDTSYYIGLTIGANARQPVIGPVLSNGLQFAYYDSTGAVTADPLRVARIDITVRGKTAQPIRTGTGSATLTNAVDSVTTSVALRNNRRF